MKKFLAKIAEIRQAGLDYMYKSQRGEINVNAILVLAVLASVTFIVLANMWGTMQTANAVIQANTATDPGTVTSKSMFGLLLWIIPLGIGLALLIRIMKSHES